MTWCETQNYLCEILHSKGFWAYQTINKPNGQPVDVIASKHNVPFIFEVKHCSNDYFKLDRVEDNQIMSIEKFKRCGNRHSYFFLYYEKHQEYAILTSQLVFDCIKKKQSSIKYEEAMKYNISILN